MEASQKKGVLLLVSLLCDWLRSRCTHLVPRKGLAGMVYRWHAVFCKPPELFCILTFFQLSGEIMSKLWTTQMQRRHSINQQYRLARGQYRMLC